MTLQTDYLAICVNLPFNFHEVAFSLDEKALYFSCSYCSRAAASISPVILEVNFSCSILWGVWEIVV